jgi:hypothetical protein
MDGQPLTPEDRQEARWMAAVRELPPRAWVIGEINDPATGELRAVHICSAPLETHFRVLRDPAFIPPTDEPIFFEEEFDVLKSKSIEQLRDVLKVKIAFPRSRVVQ